MNTSFRVGGFPIKQGIAFAKLKQSGPIVQILQSDRVDLQVRFSGSTESYPFPEVPDAYIDYLTECAKVAGQPLMHLYGYTKDGEAFTGYAPSSSAEFGKAFLEAVEAAKQKPAAERNQFIFNALFQPDVKEKDSTLWEIRQKLIVSLSGIKDDAIKLKWMNYLINENKNIGSDLKRDVALGTVSFQSQAAVDQAGLMVAKSKSAYVSQALTIFFSKPSGKYGDKDTPVRVFSRPVMWEILKELSQSRLGGADPKAMVPLLFDKPKQYQAEIKTLTAYLNYFGTLNNLQGWLSAKDEDIRQYIEMGMMTERKHIGRLANMLAKIEVPEKKASFLESFRKSESYYVQEALKHYEAKLSGLPAVTPEWSHEEITRIEALLASMPETKPLLPGRV